MVVSLNSALISKNNSNIAFGNSHKNSAKLTPQVSDEFVTKGIKQAKSPLRNFIRATLLTLGMGAAVGPSMTSCTPINPPVNPKDTTVVVDQKLSKIQTQFKKIMAPVLALDTLSKAPIDSVLVYDGTQEANFGYKVDKVKSTDDKLVVYRTDAGTNGTIVGYNTIEYTIDGDKISADFYASKHHIYKDTDNYSPITVKYAKEGSSTLEDKVYRYTIQSAKQSLKEWVGYSGKGIVKRLY